MARNRVLCALLIVIAGCGGGGGGGAGPAVTLAWAHSPSEAVHGYRIYYGTSAGRYLQSRGTGINASYTDHFVVAGLTPGVTYYFAVTTYGTAGLESAFSNEVSILVE
jgi:fibronectin type 3 domain-containing protein